MNLCTLTKTSGFQNAVIASQIIIFLNCITVVMQQIHAFVWERERGGVMNRIIFKEYFYLDEYTKIKSKSFKFKNFNLQNVLIPPQAGTVLWTPLQIEKNYQNNTYTNTRHTVNRTNSI